MPEESRRFERPSQRPAAVRPIGAPGHMGVDYEERVDFGRLRACSRTSVAKSSLV